MFKLDRTHTTKSTHARLRLGKQQKFMTGVLPNVTFRPRPSLVAHHNKLRRIWIFNCDSPQIECDWLYDVVMIERLNRFNR